MYCRTVVLDRIWQIVGRFFFVIEFNPSQSGIPADSKGVACWYFNTNLCWSFNTNFFGTVKNGKNA